MFPLYLRQKHLRDCREHFWSPLYAACIIAIWFITLSLKFFSELATLNHNKEKFPYILLLKHFQSTFWDQLCFYPCLVGCTLGYFWWIIRTLNNHFKHCPFGQPRTLSYISGGSVFYLLTAVGVVVRVFCYLLFHFVSSCVLLWLPTSWPFSVYTCVSVIH